MRVEYDSNLSRFVLGCLIPSGRETIIYYLMISTLVGVTSIGFCRSADQVSLDIEALAMVDDAYSDRDEWIKKSIRTTAKACYRFIEVFRVVLKRVLYL